MPLDSGHVFFSAKPILPIFVHTEALLESLTACLMASETFSLNPGEISAEQPVASIQPHPAEHVPSPPTPTWSRVHSRVTSKDNGLPQNSAPSSRQHARQHARATRSKSGSLSFPVFPALPEIDSEPPKSPVKVNDGLSKSLRIVVPSPNESSFLTALAAQERHVLELREELQKAEASLTNLKQQWVSQESKRRFNDSRKLHQMHPMGPGKQEGTRTSVGALGSLYADIERKKATMSNSRPTRRRVFSPSRQTRALSLVSPNSLQNLATEYGSLDGRRDRRTSTSDSTAFAEGPAEMLATADFEKQAMHPIAESRAESFRSSHSPSRRRTARASMQMATDLREGLWTFFEDLKHATYGDDARAPMIPPSKRPLKQEAQLIAGERPSSRASTGRSKSPGMSPARRPKHIVRRQTWQIRPWEYDEALVDIESSFWKAHGLADPAHAPEKPKVVKEPASSNLKTPRQLRVQDIEGERWETWDSPRDGQSPTRSNSTASMSHGRMSPGTTGSSLPTPTSSSSSVDDTTPRPSIVVGLDKMKNSTAETQQKDLDEHGRRESLPWPDLNKLKPGHLRRTASHLMDEWEKSLNPPRSH